VRMPEELDDLKKLSPQERLRRLQELKKRNLKAIEEAENLIRESERQLSIADELRGFIPQAKAVDIESLFSPEERRVFETARFVTPEAAEVAPAAPGVTEKREESLEERAALSWEEQQRLQGFAGPIYGLPGAQGPGEQRAIYTAPTTRGANNYPPPYEALGGSAEQRNPYESGAAQQNREPREGYRGPRIDSDSLLGEGRRTKKDRAY